MEFKKEIAAPATLNEEQVRLAKAFVKARHESGISIADFCSNQGISTKKWYGDDYMRNPIFESYLTALGGAMVSESELASYQIVKNKIIANATKANASVKEIDQYLNTFSYVVEAEKQERMKALGITPEHEKGNQQTVEERKAGLLARLKQN